MFARRGVAREQARRDEQWRLLVRRITDPQIITSASEEARYRAHLLDPGELRAESAGAEEPGKGARSSSELPERHTEAA